MLQLLLVPMLTLGAINSDDDAQCDEQCYTDVSYGEVNNELDIVIIYSSIQTTETQTIPSDCADEYQDELEEDVYDEVVGEVAGINIAGFTRRCAHGSSCACSQSMQTDTVRFDKTGSSGTYSFTITCGEGEEATNITFSGTFTVNYYFTAKVTGMIGSCASGGGLGGE